MTSSYKFSQFLLDADYFQTCSTEEKLNGIFNLFDNNDEGILRKNEIHQILICLFLIENKTVEEDLIEKCIGNIMKKSVQNEFGCITKEEFVENMLKDSLLSKLLK